MRTDLAIFALAAGMLVSETFADRLRVREEGLFRAPAASSGLGAKRSGGFSAPAAAVGSVVALEGRLGIKVSARDLAVRRADADVFGRTHVRLAQLFNGVEVDGRELIVHFDASGAVYEVNGDWLDTTPLAPFPAPAVKVDGADLVVYCRGDDAASARLAWRKTSGRRIVFTDAATGATLHVRRVARRAATSDDEEEDENEPNLDGDRIVMFGSTCPFPAGTAASVSGRLPAQQGGAAVEVGATAGADGKVYLAMTRGDGVEVGVLDGIATSRFRETAKERHASGEDWTGEFLSQTGWTEWNDGLDDRENALAIVRNVNIVLDFYRDVFSRSSYDGMGGRVAAWRSWQDDMSDIDDAFDNAFWLPCGDKANTNGCFFFGYDLSGRRCETALDTVCHELTHGVTSWSADLQYEAESGALNESFSDIIGVACEFAVQPRAADMANPRPGEADWFVDEDSGEAIRSMSNPRSFDQPSRYRGRKWVDTSDVSEENDNGGVHGNSGVQNHFFYLLSEGGSGVNDGVAYDLKGIGVDKAVQIAYLALTAYCGPRTDYAAVTGCWDSAALDLVASGVLTEEDYAAVAPAWAAVMGGLSKEFSTVGENAYACLFEDGDSLVVQTGKANARGRFRVTATLFMDGKPQKFTGMSVGRSAVVRNRKYGELALEFDANGASGLFEGAKDAFPVERISPDIEMSGVLDDLRVGVAAPGLAFKVNGEVEKATCSARSLPRGMRATRDGGIVGAPSRSGDGKTALSAHCTLSVEGIPRKVRVRVAESVPWHVSELDEYAQGRFAGDGLSLSVSKSGRISGRTVVDGRSVRFSARSYNGFGNGVYTAAGAAVRGARWSLVVDEDGATVVVETSAGARKLEAKKM